MNALGIFCNGRTGLQLTRHAQLTPDGTLRAEARRAVAQAENVSSTRWATDEAADTDMQTSGSQCCTVHGGRHEARRPHRREPLAERLAPPDPAAPRTEGQEGSTGAALSRTRSSGCRGMQQHATERRSSAPHGGPVVRSTPRTSHTTAVARHFMYK